MCIASYKILEVPCKEFPIKNSRASVLEIKLSLYSPDVFIILNEGLVQVWTYKNIISSDNINYDKSNDNDDTESTETTTELQIPHAYNSTNSSSSNTVTTKLYHHKFSPSSSFIPVMALTHPDFNVDQYSAKRKLFSNASVSLSSSLISIIWDKSLACIYSCFPINSSNTTNGSTVSILLIPPISCYAAISNNFNLGPASFHPTAPIACQICMNKQPPSSSSSMNFIFMVYLLTQKEILLLDFYELLNLHESAANQLHISSINGNILLTTSPQSLRYDSIYSHFYQLSVPWTRYFGLNTCVVSPISSHLSVFIEGVSNSSNNSNISKFRSVSVHPIYQTKSSIPLEVSYSICMMNKPGGDSSPFQIIGSLSGISFSNDSQLWDIPSEFMINPEENHFTPKSVKCNHNFYPINQLENNNTISEFVVIGYTFAKTIIANDNKQDPYGNSISPQLSTVPCIGIYQSNKSNHDFLDSVYLHALDADFWPGFTPTVPTEDNKTASGVLILSSNGQKLLFLLSKNAKMNDLRLNGQASYIEELTTVLTNIWTPSFGSYPNVVLGLTPILEDSNRQHLILSPPGSLFFDLIKCFHYQLLASEQVIDIKWQPPINYNSNSKINYIGMNKNIIYPLIGLLTDQRVIILDSNLHLISQRIVSINDEESVLFVETVTSISWIGSSLVYSTASGQIQYLLPANQINSSSPNFQEKDLHLHRSIGNIHSNISNTIRQETLASIAPDHTSLRSMQIIGCLPDRLLLARIKSNSKYFGYFYYFSRPFIPVESLIRGLLSQDNVFQQSDNNSNISSTSSGIASVDSTKNALKDILISYYPSSSDYSQTSNENGALPISHYSSKLSVDLFISNYRESASLVAGCTALASNQSFYNFPQSYWVSTGLKFIFSLSNNKAKEACIDLLASNPKLQEIITGDTTISSNNLPHRECILAKQLYSCACLLINYGFFNEALKLIDIIGYDELLGFILSYYSDDDPDKKLMSNFITSISDKNAFLKEILNTNLSNDKTKGNSGDLYPKKIFLKFFGNFIRRSPFISTKFDAKTTHNKSDNPSFFDIQAIDNARKLHILKRKGGLGPICDHGILSMDCIEDWIGKTNLDFLVSDAQTGKLRFNSQLQQNETEKENKKQLKNRPSTWVEDIGVGKEWDKVVGYWRFSDIILENDSDFINSVAKLSSMLRPPPCALLNFLDLSKFCSHLELISDRNSDYEPLFPVYWEISTSSVDPGEDPEKVKILNDMVFPHQDDGLRTGVIRTGLRSLVTRGSSLDIGLYHSEPERCKMTFEVMINRFEETSKKNYLPVSKTVKHLLATRAFGLPSK